MEKLILKKFEGYLSESITNNFENVLNINTSKSIKEESSEKISIKNSKMCGFYLKIFSFLKLNLFIDNNECLILKKFKPSEIGDFIEENLESGEISIKPSSVFAQKQIFLIMKEESKVLKLKDVIYKVKEIHKKRQKINELDLNFKYDAYSHQEEIYLDLTKDSNNSKKILQVAHFKDGFSGSMNYRSKILLILGLYAFLFSKMFSEHDFLKHFNKVKNQELKLEFRKMILLGNNLKQILNEINMLLNSFLNLLDCCVDDLLTKTQSEIILKLHEIINSKNFSNLNLTKYFKIKFSKAIFNKLKKYQLDLIEASENKESLGKELIAEIKKEMLKSNIKDNLKNNKSSHRIYMKLLNLPPFSRCDSLVTILNQVTKNKVFRIQKCKKPFNSKNQEEVHNG